MHTREKRLAALGRQVARLDRGLEALGRQSDRFSAIRMWLVLLGLPLVWGAFFLLRFWLGLILAAALAIAFGAVVRLHRRVEQARRDHARYRAIKAGHIARVRLEWDALPERPASAPPDHPFAADLDLIGPHSLHRLIDTSITPEGSRRLLDWLLAPAPDPAAIARRQALIAELGPLVRFRERLTLAATRDERGLSAQWSGENLLRRLAAAPPPETLRPTLRLLLALAAADIALLALDILAGWPPLWAITVLAYVALTILRRDRVGDLFGDALALADGLRRLGAVLGVLETYPYGRHDRLKALCTPLLDRRARPTAFLRRVSTLASAASLQANFLLWLPVNLIVPWDVFFAWRLSQERAALAARLPAWLEVWYELEALNSLATFAYLNPEYTFPVFVAEEPPLFDARQLGHPLIPFQTRVCNDFLIRQGEVVIITGSNMSGKSSFLRAVGVALALAGAGSVVDAAALRLTPFRLFTSLRVTDSVADGISYFYAEVKRLRALLEALSTPEGPPLFFLIDEIFRGTNNRERLIGSRAYVRALSARGGTGLIATHDLELIHLADELPNVSNRHFRETVEDGRMRFDYILRPGPCPTTNALAIMALEGLPVE